MYNTFSIARERKSRRTVNLPSPLYSMRPNTFPTARKRQPHRKQDTGKTRIRHFTACDPFFTHPASPSPILLQYRAPRSGKENSSKCPPVEHETFAAVASCSLALHTAGAHSDYLSSLFRMPPEFKSFGGEGGILLDLGTRCPTSYSVGLLT
jgi:hypothetical protein